MIKKTKRYKHKKNNIDKKQEKDIRKLARKKVVKEKVSTIRGLKITRYYKQIAQCKMCKKRFTVKKGGKTYYLKSYCPSCYKKFF